MIIRKAENRDIPKLTQMLFQVHALHAEIRPDVFIKGATKYTAAELSAMLPEEDRLILVAVDDKDEATGYAFCEIRRPAFLNNMRDIKTLYIDDLCVAAGARGHGIGKALFDRVRQEAKERGCAAVTLNVWEGNDGAKAFYEKMGMRPRSTIMEIASD